ncbi:transmembrane protein 184B [Burkholderiales bacterium GJ-E10]|nr:transmembrane protein 184B [Burkholderiales bacterium GJ-E10]
MSIYRKFRPDRRIDNKKGPAGPRGPFGPAKPDKHPVPTPNRRNTMRKTILAAAVAAVLTAACASPDLSGDHYSASDTGTAVAVQQAERGVVFTPGQAVLVTMVNGRQRVEPLQTQPIAKR